MMKAVQIYRNRDLSCTPLGDKRLPYKRDGFNLVQIVEWGYRWMDDENWATLGKYTSAKMASSTEENNELIYL